MKDDRNLSEKNSVVYLCIWWKGRKIDKDRVRVVSVFNRGSWKEGWKSVASIFLSWKSRRLSNETRRVLNPTINFLASRVFPVDRQLITVNKLNTPGAAFFPLWKGFLESAIFTNPWFDWILRGGKKKKKTFNTYSRNAWIFVDRHASKFSLVLWNFWRIFF